MLEYVCCTRGNGNWNAIFDLLPNLYGGHLLMQRDMASHLWPDVLKGDGGKGEGDDGRGGKGEKGKSRARARARAPTTIVHRFLSLLERGLGRKKK